MWLAARFYILDVTGEPGAAGRRGQGALVIEELHLPGGCFADGTQIVEPEHAQRRSGGVPRKRSPSPSLQSSTRRPIRQPGTLSSPLLAVMTAEARTTSLSRTTSRIASESSEFAP